MVSGDFRAHGGLHCRKLVFLIFIFALEHELAWFEYAQRGDERNDERGEEQSDEQSEGVRGDSSLAKSCETTSEARSKATSKAKEC